MCLSLLTTVQVALLNAQLGQAIPRQNDRSRLVTDLRDLAGNADEIAIMGACEGLLG